MSTLLDNIFRICKFFRICGGGAFCALFAMSWAPWNLYILKKKAGFQFFNKKIQFFKEKKLIFTRNSADFLVFSDSGRFGILFIVLFVFIRWTIAPRGKNEVCIVLQIGFGRVLTVLIVLIVSIFLIVVILWIVLIVLIVLIILIGLGLRIK